MGMFSTAVLVACLQGMKYLLWLTAALLVVLVLVQFLRGEPNIKPVFLGIVALLALAGGFISGRAATVIVSRASGQDR